MYLPGIIETGINYLEKGGEVMIPLMVISFWMWFLIFKKLVELYEYRRQDLHPAEGLPDTSTGWRREVVYEFLERCSSDPELDRKLMASLTKRQLSNLEKGVRTVLVLASVAPLLGLLGTVTGMMTTFDVISVFGTGNARALASGISEALITTQTGLVVAIPGLFMGNFLNREVHRCHDRMERFGLSFCRLLESKPELASQCIFGVDSDRCKE